MQKKISFLFCLLAVCCICHAQNTITGRIANTDGAPLAGANITVGKQSAVSTSAGNYVLSKIPNGKLKVRVSYVGYTSIDSAVNITGNLQLNFVLRANASKLEEVTIKQKANTMNSSVLEQKLKTETIEKYSSQTLGDALREIAGVSSLRTGSTIVKPVINGLYGSRVPVISNNVRLEDQEWGTEHAPNFDINSAGKITVIKGASGLQYGGDAVGGLVIIEPVSIKNDTLVGRTIVDYNSNGHGGAVSSAISKGSVTGFSWDALATFKYFGDRRAPDYVLSNTGNREANFSGDVKYARKRFDFALFYSYYKAEIGILSASHTESARDLSISINNNIPYIVRPETYNLRNPKQDVQHHLAKLSGNYRFSENSSLAFQYAYQRNDRLEYDVRRANYNNIPALDLDLITHTANVDYKKTAGSFTLKAGINGLDQENLANPATGIRPLIPNYIKSDFGAYAIGIDNVSDSFTIEGGLRYDFSHTQATKYYQESRWTERGYDPEFTHFIIAENTVLKQWLTKPDFTFHNISASLGFHKQFRNDWEWYANAGLATRNPNPSEFFSDGLHHSTGIIELGDLGLDKEQAVKVSTTVKHTTDRFAFEINPYVHLIDNYIFLKPLGVETTIRGTFLVWEYKQADALLSGIDVETRWNISEEWQHVFTLAYIYGENKSDNEPLIDVPPLNLSNKIRFYKKGWHHFAADLKGEIVIHQDRFPDYNIAAAIPDSSGNQIITTVDVSTPPPAYGLLDFYSEMKFKTFGSIATVAFSVQNITDTAYRDYLNRQRFFADETGRNFQIQLKINY